MQELIEIINNLKSISEDIYVCGTSIFRTLKEVEKINFLTRFKNETGYGFDIISQTEENELTVYGATRFVNQKVCVFIGGGASTEIAIYDNGIKESVNSGIGAMDVMQEFKDLSEDFATTDVEDVKVYKRKTKSSKRKIRYINTCWWRTRIFCKNFENKV